MDPKYCVTTVYKTHANVNEMKAWCLENIYESDEDGVIRDHKWICHWSGPQVEYGTEYKFWFVEHKDAMMFSLRWQ